jgi:hypothetical protein
MLPRKVLRPNNQNISKVFSKTVKTYQPASFAKDQTTFSYARAGRQNSEGFGGGNRIHK